MKRQLWIIDRRDNIVFIQMADPFVAKHAGISFHQASELALGVFRRLKKEYGRGQGPARRD